MGAAELLHYSKGNKYITLQLKNVRNSFICIWTIGDPQTTDSFLLVWIWMCLGSQSIM